MTHALAPQLRQHPPKSWKLPRQAWGHSRGLPSLLATAGPFELRLASTRRDLAKAQRLRYRVFFENGGATPSIPAALLRRDLCPFDDGADHLLVVDTAFLTRRGRLKRKVVGTYRLLRSDAAARGHGFYSGTEFDLAPLLQKHADLTLLELGRSCVDPRYRARRVIDLLWRGIGIYAAHHGVDALIGCVSLPGVDIDALAAPISFLAQHAAADHDWQVSPLPGRNVQPMRLDVGLLTALEVRPALPPLIKGYLRAGCRFSPDPVVDHAFGCTDLFAVLPLADADRRYLEHFGTPSPARQMI